LFLIMTRARQAFYNPNCRYPIRRSAAPVASLTALVLLLATGGGARAAQPGPDLDDPVIKASKARGLAAAVSKADCGGGAYSLVNSPDGTSISVLFDQFSAEGNRAVAGVVRTRCDIKIPLNLPAGYTLGVFQMDYRGFAHLGSGQEAELGVDYGVGREGGGRRFHRKLKGPHDRDFIFTEKIGTGILKRAGCGEEATLKLHARLDLTPNLGPRDAMITLDSLDGALRGGVVFYIDLKKCRT